MPGYLNQDEDTNDVSNNRRLKPSSEPARLRTRLDYSLCYFASRTVSVDYGAAGNARHLVYRALFALPYLGASRLQITKASKRRRTLS